MVTRFTDEFKAEAVRIALTSGLTRRQVANDLGVGFSTLSKWVQQDRNRPDKPAVQSDLEQELAELRRENRLLREERDILKKATQFFAERSK
ncbi:MAG: transposase [Rhizobiaceae bacterium]|nr:transposase [Rhizobiaceae bacterium]